MVKAGNVPTVPRQENGDTFHLQFGSGKVGKMGTGNFNITLANDQMADHRPFVVRHHDPARARAGLAASFIGGDLVVIPQGQHARRRRRRVHEVHPLGQESGRGLREALNLTTRSDMADNQYFKAEPLVQDVAKALAVGRRRTR